MYVRKIKGDKKNYDNGLCLFCGEKYDFSTYFNGFSIGKWKRIEAKDILLTYNTYNGTTEIKIKFLDENKHIHHFAMQLVPDNGFGNNEEDSFRFIYQFEGSFDENALSVRSFAEYLSIYLQYEGFDPQLFNCDKAISLTYSINYERKKVKFDFLI